MGIPRSGEKRKTSWSASPGFMLFMRMASVLDFMVEDGIINRQREKKFVQGNQLTVYSKQV